MLREHKIDKYVAQDGIYCLYCEVDNCYPRKDTDLIFARGEIEQDMECFSCNKRWTEVYRLSEVKETNE